MTKTYKIRKIFNLKKIRKMILKIVKIYPKNN